MKPHPPMKPRLPEALAPAALDDHDLNDEATFRRLEFAGTDLSGLAAEAVEFDTCRLARNASLSGARLGRSSLADCVIEHCDLANLRTEESSMLRVTLTTSRMTGLHWIDGSLRDVTVSQCRADLASFRFTDFHNVVFDDCNLTRADFQDADLSGVRFSGCDLTGAQFSHATMRGTRFANCVLAGVGGVTSFDGAIVAQQDLLELSYTMAAAIGIRVEGPDA